MIDATPTPTAGGRLAPVQRWILWGWLVVVIALTVVFSVISTGANEFGGLVAVVAFIFVGMSLLSLALVFALLRWVVSNTVLRTIIAVVGPPTVFLLIYGGLILMGG